MYLSMLEIKNFRSLKEITVEFEPGLNVIVGRNNTGKTNLLHAIRHALGPGASRGDSLWLEHDDFYRESVKDETEYTISIVMTFSELSEEQRAFFYETVEFDLTNINASKAIIRYEASWPKGKRQASIKRTGGPITTDPPEVPIQILESLPITFLPALRNAEAALAPGIHSRLARLLKEVAKRKGDNVKAYIEDIFYRANNDLEQRPLIKDTKMSLQKTTQDLAGSDYSKSAIRASDVDFDKILRSLHIQMDDVPIGSLDANGLGYNNLLYIAVVLEHLRSPDADEFPLLLVEEPEAHLHPQLTMLLADFLTHKTPAKSMPQTIVTTHSPTLAANIPPNCLHVLFTDSNNCNPKCNSISKGAMDEKEVNQLQRMMDITRATLYFAKGIILVEGISESLLVPVLARRLGYDLSKKHISIIPICGVAFETFKKLLNPNVLGIPAVILTDADPIVDRGQNWTEDTPQRANGNFQLSDRTIKLLEIFDGHPTVRIYHSKLTLEYDLAEAGDENAGVMAEVWESCFVRTPGTLNRRRVDSAGPDRQAKAISVWRGICRAEHTGSKAEFAHLLSAHLNKKNTSGKYLIPFEVPRYIRQAIVDVLWRLRPRNSSARVTET